MSVNELMKNQEIDIVLNLTIPKAHYSVAIKALRNDKHVYSEKPLAINLKDGMNSIKLAKRKKLSIGNAPDTFLGGVIKKQKNFLEKKS